MTARAPRSPVAPLPSRTRSYPKTSKEGRRSTGTPRDALSKYRIRKPRSRLSANPKRRGPTNVVSRGVGGLPKGRRIPCCPREDRDGDDGAPPTTSPSRFERDEHESSELEAAKRGLKIAVRSVAGTCASIGNAPFEVRRLILYSYEARLRCYYSASSSTEEIRCQIPTQQHRRRRPPQRPPPPPRAARKRPVKRRAARVRGRSPLIRAPPKWSTTPSRA